MEVKPTCPSDEFGFIILNYWNMSLELWMDEFGYINLGFINICNIIAWFDRFLSNFAKMRHT